VEAAHGQVEELAVILKLRVPPAEGREALLADSE
jgi:hypothetical protein